MAETKEIFSGKYTESIGRRKRAIARVRLWPGQGTIVVNARPLATYFPLVKLQNIVRQPLTTAGRAESFNISVKVEGGGINGQAEAVRLAIARGLVSETPELKVTFKKENLLSRDSRRRERKKPGKLGARRSPQWSKR